MRQALALAVVAGMVACASTQKPFVLLPSGTYQFQHKDAEFSNSPGFPVSVQIDGSRVVVTNHQAGRSLPVGVIEEATLMWHPTFRQWILASDESDTTAPSVGGCGDSAPHSIDFKKREIWTCEGGP